MANTTKKPMYIGILELYYLETSKITEALTPAIVASLIKDAATKQIVNSHQDTFSYEQEDGSQTEYVNELTGEIYFVDPTALGKRAINFTMGQYDYEDKAALQGGEVVKVGSEAVGWSAPTKPEVIHKALIAKCKTGNYVVFTNASIAGKTTMAEKNMGLGVVATALANDNSAIKSEYWFTGSKVDDALTAKV